MCSNYLRIVARGRHVEAVDEEGTAWSRGVWSADRCRPEHGFLRPASLAAVRVRTVPVHGESAATPAATIRVLILPKRYFVVFLMPNMSVETGA